MDDILKTFNTADTWIDVETVAGLKNVKARAIRIVFKKETNTYIYKEESSRGGKAYFIKLSSIEDKQFKYDDYPGRILQDEGQLATSVNTQYDNDSAVISSNLDYAAIHQLGGKAGRNKTIDIPARQYLHFNNSDY